MAKVDFPARGPKCSVSGCSCPAAAYHNMCAAHLQDYLDSVPVRLTTYPKPADAAKTRG